MSGSLHKAAYLREKDGVIIVIEPGESGSFTLVKELYGVGRGDQRSAQEAAIRVMHALDDWHVGETVPSHVKFQFDNSQIF
jgi:hypothetical protein